MSGLDLSGLRCVAFAGKGGVGKTTCSAALALALSRGGERVLLVSSDPEPSISDLFGVDVRGRPREVAPNLEAVELDGDSVLEMWRERYGEEVYRVVSGFIPVGREIVDYVAGAPGIAEEFSLAYLLDFWESGNFDRIVWDTAPAGGTLSLLRLEQTFYDHLGEAAGLFLRIRDALDRIRRGGWEGGRGPLEIIGGWRNLLGRVLGMLRSDRLGALVVSEPEALSAAQALRIADRLEEFGVRVAGLVINGLISEDLVRSCPRLEARLRGQGEAVSRLLLGRMWPQVVEVPLMPRDISSRTDLRPVAEALMGGGQP